MRRNTFIKYISLTAIFPSSFANSKEIGNSSISNNLSNYNLIDDIEKYGLSFDDLDGVIFKKKNGNYYLYQSSIIDIKEFGAVGDGNVDDTLAVQKAFDSCVKFRKALYVSRPIRLSYLCKKSIKVSGQINVHGDGMSQCGFNFLNSNGFEILEGVSNVIFEKLSINQAKRFTNNVDSYIGVNFFGTDQKRPYTNVFRDVFIDGFQTAIRLNWMWDSLFDNVKIVFCNIGFDILGTSVNNIISNSSISVEGKDSRAIYFSDKINPTEGWRITSLLTFGADIAIEAYYTSNIYFTSPILDFCRKRAVKLDDGVGPSTNWQILGGYIAMSANSEAAIEVNTAIDNNQIRGNKFTDLDILSYNGTMLVQAFKLTGKFNITSINNISITNTKKLR